MRRAGTIAAALLIAGTLAAGAAFAAGRGGDGPRTIEVTLRYSRFEPGSFAVGSGETVRFVVRNADPIDHEFILGDASVQRVHELGTEAHHAPRPGEISVPPGATVVTTYTFPTGATTLLLGCHLPGHYAYGMRADVRVA